MKGRMTVAVKQEGVLRITEHTECPYCSSIRETHVHISINACEQHLWVSKKWFEAMKRFILS